MLGKETAKLRVTLTQLTGVGAANTLGHAYGGYIMKLCDEAGGMAASKHARWHCVTVAVDSMTSHSPVQSGNLAAEKAEVTWTRRTSLETRMLVTAEDVISGAVTQPNTAYFDYVALGEDGRPSPVPPIIYTNQDELDRFERAAFRQ